MGKEVLSCLIGVIERNTDETIVQGSQKRIQLCANRDANRMVFYCPALATGQDKILSPISGRANAEYLVSKKLARFSFPLSFLHVKHDCIARAGYCH